MNISPFIFGPNKTVKVLMGISVVFALPKMTQLFKKYVHNSWKDVKQQTFFPHLHPSAQVLFIQVALHLN